MAKPVEVNGDKLAARRLKRLGKTAEDQRRTFLVGAHYAQDHTSHIPVDTGALAASVKGGKGGTVRVTKTGFVVATKVFYSRFVFGGTKNMPARPPQVPPNLADYVAKMISTDLNT